MQRKAKAWDLRLVHEYARRVVFPHFAGAMGVYLDQTPSEPCLRVACVDGLEDGSHIYDGYGLDVGGRRVGVEPEALEAARLRSFEICERSTQMPYPALAGEQRALVEQAPDASRGSGRAGRRTADSHHG